MFVISKNNRVALRNALQKLIEARSDVITRVVIEEQKTNDTAEPSARVAFEGASC